jgi:hypothetical protein
MSIIAYLSKADQVRSKKPYKNHKQVKKKKVATPTPDAEKICVGCGNKHSLSIHHCYYGRGIRDLSSRYKCVDWLCWHCHQSSTGIHGTHTDGKLDAKLKRKHQLRLMEGGMSLDEFISIFGRSYCLRKVN